MPIEEPTGTTAALVLELADGDEVALGLLWMRIHERVRAMAARALSREGHDPTLEPTELVSEVFLRLHGSDRSGPWRNRAHFFGSVARAIVQILIDRARSRRAAKRGGGASVASLVDDGGLARLDDDPAAVEALRSALDELTSLAPRCGEIAWLRFVIGLSVPQVAETIGVSPRTVDSDWAFARAWLRERLSRDGSRPTSGER